MLSTEHCRTLADPRFPSTCAQPPPAYHEFSPDDTDGSNNGLLEATKRVIINSRGTEISAMAQPMRGSRLFLFCCEGLPECRENSGLPEIFIAKPFRHQTDDFVEDEPQKCFDDNEDELWVYNKLGCLQGEIIPRCYGRITWQDVDVGVREYAGIAVEYLEKFRSLKRNDTTNEIIYTNCQLAFEAIGKEGIMHGDVELQNILVEPDTKEVRIIDFEYSKLSTAEWHYHSQSIQRQNEIDLAFLFNRPNNLATPTALEYPKPAAGH